MHIEIEVNGASVLLYAVLYPLCPGVIYLYVLTVFVIDHLTCGIGVPNGGRTVPAILSSLTVTASVHPLDNGICIAGTEIVVPSLYGSLKRTVNSVLVYLVENVGETDVTACGSNVVLVIGSCGEHGLIGKVSSILQLTSKELSRPLKRGAYSLGRIQIVCYRYGVSSFQHRKNDINVGHCSNALSHSVNDVQDNGSAPISGHSRTVGSMVVIYRYLNRDTDISVT